MSKEKILEYFSDINYAYNDCTRLETLKNMLNELKDVVRCKDCKWFDEQEVCNKKFMVIMDTNFFCADGVKKDG